MSSIWKRLQNRGRCPAIRDKGPQIYMTPEAPMSGNARSGVYGKPVIPERPQQHEKAEIKSYTLKHTRRNLSAITLITRTPLV